jgi:anti-sigma-K factor RskA
MADEHDPIDELLGAYALDAVDEDERRLVEEYLATDPRARAEVEQHREVASYLAFSGEAAPEGLWEQIAGALEEQAPLPGPRLARVLPARRRRWTTVVVAAAAAVLVVAAAVTATWLLTDRDGSTSTATSAIEQAYGEAWSDPSGRRAELRSDAQAFTADAVVLPDGTGFLAATSLPALPDSETWQLWGVYGDGDVISLGVLGSRPQIQAFTASDDLTALVITREQAGGVQASTTGAVLTGQL